MFVGEVHVAVPFNFNSLEPQRALRHRGEWGTYMRITGCKVGLLINFNKPTLIDGVKRFVL